MVEGISICACCVSFSIEQGKDKASGVEEKVFRDEELTNLIDPILNVDDANQDGFIDYPEFIRAQQKAAAGQQKPTS